MRTLSGQQALLFEQNTLFVLTVWHMMKINLLQVSLFRNFFADIQRIGNLTHPETSQHFSTGKHYGH